jgi:hypothetical protein
LFGGAGLGINSEILSKLNFEIIEIPYNNETLKTSREHFINYSIPSPFTSDRVDSQKILFVKDFVMPQEEAPKEKQTNLFEREAV